MLNVPCVSWRSHERGWRDFQGDESPSVEDEDDFPSERRSEQIPPRHVRSGIAQDDQDLDETCEDHQEDGRDDLVADRVIVGDALQHVGLCREK